MYQVKKMKLILRTHLNNGQGIPLEFTTAVDHVDRLLDRFAQQLAIRLVTEVARVN